MLTAISLATGKENPMTRTVPLSAIAHPGLAPSIAQRWARSEGFTVLVDGVPADMDAVDEDLLGDPSGGRLTVTWPASFGLGVVVPGACILVIPADA